MGKHGKFMGYILDGSDGLAFLTSGHFITFQLDAGPHVFTANSWLNPTQTAGGHLKLDLVPGQHYYVGAYLDNRGILVSLFRLELQSCDQVRKETAKITALAPKHLRGIGQARALTESTFPACTAPAQPPPSSPSVK